MHFGASMFCTDYSMTPVELALALEERGFESLWFPEHSHIPVARTSPFQGGGELPKRYYDVIDPFVAAGSAAAVTKTLKLGTGICLIIQRDPIQTAKEVATIDFLSGGRFIFGIGAGWNAEEMADHGTAFSTRVTLMRERVEAMQAIWTQSKPEYHGKFVDFPPMMTWPKPVQKPYPPIIVGGDFPHAARRAIAYGNGWMPLSARPGHDLLEFLPRFRQMVAEADRDPDSIPVSSINTPPDIERLKRLKEGGVERACVSLPSGKADEILPLLDRWAGFMRQVTG
ncbi:MAG: LLM class F420-dependent oxidoreductase [Alphaproteobacteria bacterium]|nr:LLM class F420-dependent oxidoreductase [Alphaproteobacteria bacterium]